MKGEFYKMDYEAWDEGTDELSLEQEAAYLRLCHQLYRRKAAIPSAPATLARIWRCHPNKARKLLADLVAAGKVVEADGHLTNTRVTRELDERETRRTQKADAGHTGGTQTQENRRKALKTNDADATDAGTPDKQNQTEREKEEEGEKKEQIEATPQSVSQVDDGWPSNAFDLFWSEYPSKVAKEPARKSFATVRKSRRVTFDAMMAGLRRYIATKPPTRDWMHPTTWLNQGRWSDQPAPSSLVRPAPVGGRAPSHQDHFLRLAAEGHHELTGGDDGSDPFHDDVGPLFGAGGQGNGFGGAAPVVRDAGVRQLPPRRDPRSLGPH